MLDSMAAKAILDARAAALAQVPAADAAPHEMLEAVIFSIGAERFALETQYVRSAIKMSVCTPVPGLPRYFLGAINVRGEVVALVNLAALLFESQGMGECNWVLLLGREATELGVPVEKVLGVTHLSFNQILEAPAQMTKSTKLCLRGVTSDGTIIIDGDLLLKDEQFFVEENTA